MSHAFNEACMQSLITGFNPPSQDEGRPGVSTNVPPPRKDRKENCNACHRYPAFVTIVREFLLGVLGQRLCKRQFYCCPTSFGEIPQGVLVEMQFKIHTMGGNLPSTCACGTSMDDFCYNPVGIVP
eukprot:EG_transcript_43236